MPPQFSSKSYWNSRFTSDPSPFDWLLPASALDSLLRSTLSSSPFPNPKVLHIGCGTSWLSFHLRAHVEKPNQVLNLDFSETAIDLGKTKEADLYRPDEAEVPEMLSSSREWCGAEDDGERMQWAAADLLEFSSLVSATGCSGPQFAVILDKSTSDAISCAQSIPATEAFLGIDAGVLDSKAFSAAMNLRERSVPDPEHLLDPMIVLSLHLAAITREGGTWIAVSYSQDRFWFLERNLLNDTEADSQKHGSNKLDPKRFWRLARKEALEIQQQDEPSISPVHRPNIQHWLYLVLRTDELLP